MPLSKKAIDELKPKGKPYMISDVEGLYLEVHPSGTKTWKFRAMKNGKQMKNTLGHYPAIPLSEARAKAIEQQTKLERGEPLISPVKEKEMKFSELAEKFMEFKKEKAESYKKSLRIRIDKHILPAIGKLELSEITMKTIVDLYDKIVAERNSSGGQKYDTGSRVKQVVGEIMRYGRAKGETKNDPTAEWILENQGVKSHYAAAL